MGLIGRMGLMSHTSHESYKSYGLVFPTPSYAPSTAALQKNLRQFADDRLFAAGRWRDIDVHVGQAGDFAAGGADEMGMFVLMMMPLAANFETPDMVAQFAS